MRKIIKTALALFLLTQLWACDKENDTSQKEYVPKFIVEGWIENGQYPHVILSHNVPFFSSLDSAQLSELIIRFAKITVSDGVKTEVLTTTLDDNYFPSFIYRGYDLKGESGKTYTLKIEYAGNTITSTTRIPEAVPLDSLWFSKREKDKMQLIVQIKDKAMEKNYYRLYTKIRSNKVFIPILLSNLDDRFFSGQEILLQVNRGSDNNLTVKNEPYFERGDTVLVKFSNIPKEGFDFWNSIQDEVLNSINPLVGSTGSIKSNITGPAAGIWCGYGSTIHKVIAKEE
ncbi:MAG: DUF4249 domain-containing protein [Pyrinomonadaceae bacterium]|nr:DUF4249 domain-containing protein [Sphingobacteriaceae bacterium]